MNSNDTSSAHEKLELINKFATINKLGAIVLVTVVHQKYFYKKPAYTRYHGRMHYDGEKFTIRCSARLTLEAYADGTCAKSTGYAAYPYACKWSFYP